MAVDLHPSPRRNSVSCHSSRLKSDSQPCSSLVFLGVSHAETLTENSCQSLHPSFSLSPFPLFHRCLLLTHLRFSHSFERNSIPRTLSPGFFFFFFGERNLICPHTAHILITFKHLQMQFENKVVQTLAGGFAVSRSCFFEHRLLSHVRSFLVLCRQLS